MLKSIYVFLFSYLLLLQPLAFASGTLSKEEIDKVNKTEITNDKQRQQLSVTAGLLADYEIAAKKLVAGLDDEQLDPKKLNNEAYKLLNLSESVIESARFRLPQCEEYLNLTLVLKDKLNDISHASLESDYHHDGALPKAPGECYHTKDLFVHPATVIVLTRDDPTLAEKTKASINSEITEVLAHTELVRQLVIY